jgi:UDP-glucose-4-epimerase GalE
MRVVVTGGAGYVGSHVSVALRAAGFTPIVVDDLSGGHADSVGDARLVRGDICAPGLLAGVVEEVGAGAILHFAARIAVGESVARPDLYYATNTGGMLRVVEAAALRRLPVIFSSTAAVYGEPSIVPIPVDHPCAPASPYGASKHMGERMLADAARAGLLRYAALRYFNAAGAAHGLAERHHPETHLVPLAIDAALGHRPPLDVFGDDWPTPDGTCLRDYVHVVDLADAHVRAMRHLVDGGASLTVNLGGGVGTSVRQVLDTVAAAAGRPVPHRIAPRRDGDVAQLIADISAAKTALDWHPRRSAIATIVADALATRPQQH